MKKSFLFRTVTTLLAISMSITVSAHPGRTDSKGGHTVSADGWGYPVGTYHYHSRYETIVPVDKETGKVLGITVIVDKENVLFDQLPENINGRIMVPIRYVVEKMGCAVEWDGDTQTVYINEPDVAIEKTAVKTDNINVYVNNESVNFTDQQPVNKNGRILIPVRFVTEKLGYDVEWDDSLQIVYIDKADQI